MRKVRHCTMIGRLLLAALPALFLHCAAARRPPASDEIAGPAPGEGRLLSDVAQLTFEGRRSGEGYFSNDGSMMVFQSEREPDNPFYQIYLLNLATGETHRVSPGFGKTTCAWIDPSRTTVLFASTHADPDARAKQQEEIERRTAGATGRYAWDYDEFFDIFEADLRGGHLRNLTHATGYDAEGSWSPDGKLIVFASNRHAYAEELPQQDQVRFDQDRSFLLDVYRMNADGSDVRRLTTASGADGGPFFSPDGGRIVWRHFSDDGATAEIFTMKVDGTDQRRITHLGAMSWAPYFHPSGDYLIFSTNLHGFGNFELYLVDVLGRADPIRVTFTDGFDGLPVFAPDGQRLAWTSTRTARKQAQVFLADWNDAEARHLLDLGPGFAAQSRAAPESSITTPAPKHTVTAIRASDIRAHVTTLASEMMDGRLTGTDGERRATRHVASVLASYGLEPAGDNGTFFQDFDFTAGVSLGPHNQLTLTVDGRHIQKEFAVDRDWRPLAFSRVGAFEPSEVVFAGYGIVAAANGDHAGYDSYADVDVTDKWAVIFRYLPEGAPPARRYHLSQFASLRFKAMIARDHGARGLIVVSGPSSGVKDELIRLSFDASLAGSSLAAISVTDRLADELLAPSGRNLHALQTALDGGDPVAGFSIPGVVITANVDVQQEKRTGRNVLARLPGGPKGGGEVIVGAHIDHLGEGFATATLARREEEGMIHYGADDNASGVAGALEIAEHLADQKARGALPMQHDLLFAFWSGEELGLLGSSHFTRTFGGAAAERTTLTPDVVAYLNMDMIGRLNDKLVLFGVGSSSSWPAEIERQNTRARLPIVEQNTSYLPTDATSFYVKEVPILSAFTGAHHDYHTPRDTADRLDYSGAASITRLMARIARSVVTSAQPPDYVVMEKPGTPVGRTNLRAYLGTIPDYAATDVVGVRLTGVAKGGPADRAGVRGGDIVVELAGKKVENLYDYTFSLGLVKIGVPVPMTVRRGTQRLGVTVTPASRE